MVFKDIKLNKDLIKFELKPFKKDFIPQIVTLFKEVFNRELKNEYWNWKFLQNPYGQIPSLTLWDNNELIGTYFAEKRIFYVKDQKYDFALGSTAMVNNNYRRKGIFTYLVKTLYNTLSESGFSLFYGFPNEKYDCPLYLNKYSWNYCEKKNILIKELGKNSSLKNNLFNTNNFSIKQIKKYPSKINQVIDKENRHGIYLFRTSEYLDWRFTLHPFNDYKNFLIFDKKDIISGFFVLKSYTNENGERFGEINDFAIFVDNSDLIHKIIDFSIKYFIQRNHNFISVWLGENSNYFKILTEKQGFKCNQMKSSWGYIILNDMNENTKNYIMDSKNWDLRMGDSDVF